MSGLKPTPGVATPPTFIKEEKRMGREKKKRMGRMNGRKVDELIRAQLAFFRILLISLLSSRIPLL